MDSVWWVVGRLERWGDLETMGLPISPNGPEGSVGFLLVFETAEAAKEAAGECPVIPLKEAEDG